MTHLDLAIPLLTPHQSNFAKFTSKICHFSKPETQVLQQKRLLQKRPFAKYQATNQKHWILPVPKQTILTDVSIIDFVEYSMIVIGATMPICLVLTFNLM